MVSVRRAVLQTAATTALPYSYTAIIQSTTIQHYNTDMRYSITVATSLLFLVNKVYPNSASSVLKE